MISSSCIGDPNVLRCSVIISLFSVVQPKMMEEDVAKAHVALR